MMKVPMRIEGHGEKWDVSSEEELVSVLLLRDARGGAELWLSRERQAYPTLALQLGGSLGSATFFPQAGHPGFRCVRGQALVDDGFTKIVFQGCDPSDGEEVPNEFVLGFESLVALAKVFFLNGGMSTSEQWLEL
jgi:hypothetical protein